MVAEAFAARLILFTAVGGEERQALVEFAAAEGIALNEAADAFVNRLARWLPDTLEVERHHRLSDNPAAAIVEFADEIGASVIVMASHGRSGVSRWLLGSVADKIVQSSAVPVLVVPVRDRP
jgi:nucleotide-binding universal stress UspA family protein